MKSIIEQASSIMKAIEKAWNQAEQPKEFSIKIFEKEERNFFGMTTKPAKIGIFFGDKPIVHDKQAQKLRPEIKECRPEVRPKAPVPTKPMGDKAESKQQTQKSQVIKQEQQSIVRPTAQSKQPLPRQQSTPEKHKIDTSSADKPRRTPAAWNDTMITTAHNWLKKTLALMNMQSIEFSSNVEGKNLKLTFSAPLIADATHEKQLFRSFAHLIMSSLRNKYKQEIKDLKVILIRPE